MIQFNLLPNVKLEFIKAQRLKRAILSVAVIVSGASLLLLVLLFLAVDVFQKQYLKSVNNDIQTNSAKLQSITDIDKVLTIQNQLISLPGLHASKPVTSRLFTYLKQIVPDKVKISQLDIDFDQHTLTFTGSADELSTVNKFVDTLKFTTYTTGAIKGDWQSGTSYKLNDLVAHNNVSYVGTTDATASNDNEPGVGAHWQSQWKLAPSAFSNVVLASFSRSGPTASFTVSLDFDSAIFNSANTIALNVPKIVTTRSETEHPSDLFAPTTNSTGQ